MIKINKEQLQMEGSTNELLTEISSAFATLAKDTDRTMLMSMFLSGFYVLQAEVNGGDMIKAIDMFKEDTKEALNIISQYMKVKGNTLDEKTKNIFGTED